MHRPIIVPPETIPSNQEAVLSPTECPSPPTTSIRSSRVARAHARAPRGREGRIRYAINGLISMTPDGHPLLGETPEVKGLWAAAASWIKEGPGCGRAVAELMSGQVPTIDVHEAAVSRFYPSSRTTGFARARAAESFNKMYGIVHPAEQYESERPLRTGPLYERGRELGAVFHGPPAGSGRTGTRPTSGCSRGTRPAHGRPASGIPLVVADHQRRAPGDARGGGDGGPVRFHDPRRHRPRGARPGCSASPSPSSTSRSDGPSTRRC